MELATITKKEEPDCDSEHVTASSNLNYDSSDSISTSPFPLHLKIKNQYHLQNNNNNNHNNNNNNTINNNNDNINGSSDNDEKQSLVAAVAAAAAASILPQLTPLALLENNNNINKISVNNNNSLSAPNNNNNALNQNNNNNNSSNNGNAGNGNPNRKLFECDVCNMKFSNGANMRRHKMRHTGVKPYECRVCQKRFFRKDHLAEHFTTHTKTLPYHCPICNRGFQRQIAMRAHFQNEHVGQHDLVKTCPLCSYRAGTMKSLRVHFFNRHGIDLDNPGPGAPSSLLLALEQQNAAHLLPALTSMTALAASYNGDSADSVRSNENVTPPMHFLTPHVEISMADNDGGHTSNGLSNHNDAHSSNTISSGGLDIKAIVRPTNGCSPVSPNSADSNSNVPSSSHSLMATNSRHMMYENSITPSISLIPIKQEPANNDDYHDTSIATTTTTPSHTPRPQSSSGFHEQHSPLNLNSNSSVNSSGNNQQNPAIGNSSESSAAPTSSLTSLIKVSPLKSLLREDLKRRISARANNRAARVLNSSTSPAGVCLVNTTVSSGDNKNGNSGSGNNGTGGSITRSSLSSSNNNNNNESTSQQSSPPIVATTSNGIITSTGNETELILSGKKRHLQCLFCGIEFPDQTLYFLHKGCHSESNPWKCNICGEQMQNVYEFNSHLLSKSHQ